MSGSPTGWQETGAAGSGNRHFLFAPSVINYAAENSY